ncbi:MAG: rhomboid family intrarane serine protease [Sphingobacterium sp.]|jgi:rhomboid-like protein|uniref:rhomboid family intramembrane serine protease n=1 Tax=Sphingobacterium sp. CZ-UAM TaxID=1933868 RepID=UPI000984CBF8|nr:rhomboid family intramembrane serine protease [Sphingobacterium sp. CZ-UAM]MDF2517286.1 rhomboid family intrarane serine protease [Sphingobacterium sp.]OOG17391.1 rhomboid family intramembrane serine protease [Sphingobacterium sp. CZ-UAM]
MFQQLTPVIKNLLIVNIVFFLGSQFVPIAYNYLPVFYPDSPYFKIWQVITHMFMHADLGHIFFNMFSLVIFGPMIEQVLGSKRFLNFYLISGIGAWLLQMGVQGVEIFNATGSFFPLHHSLDLSTLNTSNPGLVQEVYTSRMLGASGAIYGVLLAFAYLFPNIPLQFLFIPVPIKAKYMIGGYILIEIYMSLSRPGDSVAHLAHVGGALFGYLLLKLWRIRKGIY